MYIAIEGVKGVGKSTLIEKLQNYFLQHKIDFVLACPTRPTNKKVIKEWFFEKTFNLFHIDKIKELLYAYRSNITARETNWGALLVLGDRSIATSYVTRYWKYQSSLKQIEKVDQLEPLLPAPDVIIYLHADLLNVSFRLSQRNHRLYGKEDESPEKILQDSKAYEFIMKVKPSRLKKTRWYIVDATQNPEEVFESVIHIIEKLINTNQYDTY